MEELQAKSPPSDEPPLRVDLDEVLKRKASRVYPLIPGFVIRYLKRVLHQNEINEILHRLDGVYGLDFVNYIVNDYFNMKIQVVHPENIPATGRYVMAANHPLGGLDGMAVMHVLGKKRQDFKFLSNDVLLELKNINMLFLPVDMHRRNTQEAVRRIDELFASDEMVLVFPSGLVSRRLKKGLIADLPWKKSFLTKAIRHRRDILPVHIAGRNTDFFYNFAYWRKRLGIKTNIEMLYLVDEMYKQQDQTVTLTFGRPIPYQRFTSELNHHDWAQRVREHVYRLPQGHLDFE